MATQFEVNGTATIQTGTGATGALQDLGVTFDGCTVAIEIIRAPIYTDAFGGPEGTVADHQYLGEFAHVRAELIFWDNAVFDKIWGAQFDITAGTGTGPGTTIEIGSILGQLSGSNRGYHRLVILSPIATRPYDWARAFLATSPRKVGTRVTRIQCEWYCWQQASAAGTIWFDRAVP